MNRSMADLKGRRANAIIMERKRMSTVDVPPGKIADRQLLESRYETEIIHSPKNIESRRASPQHNQLRSYITEQDLGSE